MDAIDVLLTRGVDKIYPSREALEKVLRSGKKLRLYQGFDPTGTQFHIGHAVGLRKLKHWQELGHHVIFLIGDGTGLAGDPSGKVRAREQFLSNAKLRKNAKNYVMQAAKVVRFDGPNAAEILYNGDWLRKLTLEEILDIAGRISFQQMVERDLYQERLKSGITFSLREFFYPLLQGYDSVAMNVDLELGGSDQTFNMLMGRHLVKSFLNKDKFVITVPLLTDAKGTKIGKTEGNVIGITDPPNEFFGKIMALGDDAIVNCFTLLTDTPVDEIERMKEKMERGENPMTFKKQLAFALTKQFNTVQTAQAAQTEFEQVHQKGERPDDAPVFTTTQTEWNPVDLLVASGLAASKSDAKRLIEQGAVEINGEIVSQQLSAISVKNNDIMKVGKKKFLKIHTT